MVCLSVRAVEYLFNKAQGGSVEPFCLVFRSFSNTAAPLTLTGWTVRNHMLGYRYVFDSQVLCRCVLC